MIALLLPVALAAPCPASLAQLQAASTAAMAARGPAFVDAHQRAQALLDCVEEPVTPTLAAELHYLAAMAAFRERNLGIVVDHLHAASIADEAALNSEVPAGHALSDLAAEAQARPVPDRAALLLVEEHYARVDGRIATTRAATLPAVVQVLDASGDVAWSAMLAPTDGLPAHLQLPLPAERPPLREQLPAWGMFSGLAVSGVSWGISLSARAEASRIARQAAAGSADPELEATLRALTARANRWGYAGQASAALAAGCGVTAVVIRW